MRQNRLIYSKAEILVSSGLPWIAPGKKPARHEVFHALLNSFRRLESVRHDGLILYGVR